MDFQHRVGGKTGSGGVASESEANRDRRERLRQLALDTIDLEKDPYFMKNHLGTYECKLCLTLHNNEGSYLAHTQGKKHQYNLQRRAHEQAKESPATLQPEKAKVEPKKFIKIGRPGYKVTKQKDPETGQQSMLFQIDYPEIADAAGVVPRHRFMSAYEQHVEPPDRKWQYLLFAAEPYETIAFKVRSREVDKDPKKFWTYWNPASKQFFLQFAYKLENQQSSVVLRELELQKVRAQQAQMQLQLPPPPPPPPPPAPTAMTNYGMGGMTQTSTLSLNAASFGGGMAPPPPPPPPPIATTTVGQQPPPPPPPPLLSAPPPPPPPPPPPSSS